MIRSPFLVASAVILITLSAAAAAAAEEEESNIVTQKKKNTIVATQYVAPCTWLGEISAATSASQDDDDFYSLVRASFDKLNTDALKNASADFSSLADKVMKKQQNEHASCKSNVPPPRAEATIVSVLFAVDPADEGKLSPSDVIREKLVSAKFVQQLVSRQKTVRNNCRERVVQLTLVVYVDPKRKNKDAVAATEFRQKQGPILYGVLPAAPWTFNEKFLADVVSPSSSSQSGGAIPLHRYEGEKEMTGSASFISDPTHSLSPSSTALHQFLLSLRDLRHLVALKMTPENEPAPADADMIFNTVPLYKSPETVKNARRGTNSIIKTVIGSDTLFVRCDSAQDIVSLRDDLQPKRIIFVVNDAAVLCSAKGAGASSAAACSVVIAAASEGRALFVWHRRDDDDIDAERRLLRLRSDYNEYSPPHDLRAIMRVNSTIDFQYAFFAANNKKKQATSRERSPSSSSTADVPVLLLLSDLFVDDGVVPFQGSWEFSSSTASGSGVLASATGSLLDDANAQAELLKAASIDETVMLPGDGEKTAAGSDEKTKKKNENKNNKRKETAAEKKTSVAAVSSSSSSTSSKLLASSVPAAAVQFVSHHANPGVLEPLYEDDRKAAMLRSRFFGVVAVKTFGFDAHFNSHVAGGMLIELLDADRRTGIRTGGLVPFRYVGDGEAALRKADGNDDGQIAGKEHLVPIMFLNHVLHGDFLNTIGVGTMTPCFFIYDRRDKRMLTDRKLFAIQTHQAAGVLRDSAVDVWQRAEKFVPWLSEGERNELGIVSEATTLSGQVMQWLEERVPYLLSTRLWMRITPDEMLMTVAAVIVAYIIVIVVIVVVLLLNIPEGRMEKIVFGTEEEKAAAKAKVRAAAEIRAKSGPLKDLKKKQ